MALEIESVLIYPNFSTQLSFTNWNCTFTQLTSLQSLEDLVTDPNCFRHSSSWTTFLCVLYTLVFLFGLVGNLVVIYVLGWRDRMCTLTNMYLLNLAVADMLVVLCCLPANILANIFYPWILGRNLCKFFAFIQSVSIFAAVYSLVFISVYRCRTVRDPIASSVSFSKPRVLLCIAAIWIFAVLLSLPWLFEFDIIHVPETGSIPYCYETWSQTLIGLLYFVGVQLFICYKIPVLVIAYCNYQIWKVVKTQEQLPTAQPEGSRAHHGVTIEEIRRSTQMHIFKLLSILTGTFCFCWLPFHLVMGWIKIVGTPEPNPDGSFSWEMKLLDILIPLCQLFGASNSCINPMLYAFLNKRFMQTVAGMWRSCKNRCCPERAQNPPVHSTSGRICHPVGNVNSASNRDNQQQNEGSTRIWTTGGINSGQNRPGQTQEEISMTIVDLNRTQSSQRETSTQLTGQSASMSTSGTEECRIEYMTTAL